MRLLPKKPPPPIPAEWTAWFEGKTFSADWTSPHFASWARHLAPRRDEIRSVLEIGSWEGRSAIFFAQFLPASRLVCVDVFGRVGRVYANEFGDEQPHIEARFDANTKVFGDRIRKMATTSADALVRLGRENSRFDLVYVDGCHDRDVVLVDSLLAWPLLNTGGTLIWDDYRYFGLGLPDEKRPKSAIDAFLKLHRDDVAVLEARAQVVVRRLS